MTDFDERSFDEWLDQEREALEDDGWEEAPVRRAQPRRRQAYAAPAPAPKRRRGPWDRWKFVLIPMTVLLLAGVFLLGAGFVYADRVAKIDTIYPNVSVNGVAVGGMTVEEAARALGDAPDRYTNAAVTVNFSTGDSVTVTAQELGLQAVDGADFARMAYSYGRDGTMLANLMAYRACESEPVDIAAQRAETVIDQSVISAKVGPVAEQVDKKLSTVQASVGENEITLVKNSGVLAVDVPAVCALIEQAFRAEDYTPIQYDVTAQPDATGVNDRDALLQSVYDHIFVAPVDAMYDQAAGTVTEGVEGVRFDMDEARRLWDETAEGGNVVIPLIREAPAVTSDQLVGLLFKDVLAEKSTSLSGSTSNRINNITLAAAAMNGTIIQPGEEFDYNACLGQRTTAKGYKEAGAFASGQHVMSVGGGICQGSSTLYFCAVKANLTITERHCHQFVVGYLPRGTDATVSWGYPDFKFVNSRSYPIKLEAFVSGGALTIRILGTDVDGSYVIITNETWEDDTHYYAQTWRNVYDKNDNLISSAKEAYSSYDKEEAVQATPAPTQPPAPPVESGNSGGGQSFTPPTVPETVPDPVPEPDPEPEPEPEPEPDPEPDPLPEEPQDDTVENANE